MDVNRAADILPEIVRDLLSYDEAKHRRVLDDYFDPDAKLSHPLLTTKGTHNIRKVFRVWTSLNAQEPTIEEVPVFDGKTAVVRVTQHLRPRVMPFIHLKVPAVTILKFRNLDDKFLIYKQEDNWTLEGLIQSVPLVNWWYENVVRVVMGELFSRAGSFLYHANQTTTKLTDRAGEIGEKSRFAITQGQTKAQEFVAPYHAKAQSIITPYSNKAQELISPYSSKVQDITGRAKTFVWTAQEEVKSQVVNQFSKVRGVQHDNGTTYTNGDIVAAH